MSLIDDIKRDREAGTPGPWFSLPMQGPRRQTNFARVFATDDDLRYIADCRDSMNFHSATDNETNARRVARVPDLEAALLAAEELAEAITHERELACQDMGMQLDASKAVDDALAAYREALK